MAYDFKLPDVGEGIHEAVIVKWLIAEGDAIKEDQPFVEVETDKAVVELPSPVSGIAGKLHFKPGDLAHVGDVLITFLEKGEQSAEPAPKTPADKTAAAKKDREAEPAKAAATPAKPGDQPEKPEHSTPSRRPLATPHTRALARRLGVDLTTVTPSGKGGRITDQDVENAASGKSSATPVSTTMEPDSVSQQQTAPTKTTASEPLPEIDFDRVSSPKPVQSGEIIDTEWGPAERVKITRLRQVIARNMAASKQTLAHVTHVDETDVTDLAALYKKVKQQVESSHNIKFTIMPFFVKAAVAAMKKYPTLNASFNDETLELTIKHYYNVGFAADTPEGLVVPVIKNADRKDMIRIAAEIADKAARARERKLALDEMQGAGFTITNVGPLGGIFATPVIPMPQLAILGMHAIKDRPVVRDGQIIIRKMMNLSITFDHRMIDGMAAANFLREIISLVENPEMLMLRLV
jgi:pyruvate dehydrogenase E2 component (dihydrolipoamide acetyltransferase)